MTSGAFPIKGVVGVIGGDPAEVEQALAQIARGDGRPDAVEVRADLFPSPREGLEVLARLPRGLPAIFTARLPAHGGRFDGPEPARIDLYRSAVARGAALIDVELGSEAARVLAREHAPLVISHHDFSGMPAAAEIERLTRAMESLQPRALKIVPTAASPADGVTMLEWVRAGRPDGPRRIGFAMGEMGLASRVLSPSRGAPFTYAAFRQAVAPGQPTVAEMVGMYRAASLGPSTRVFGVVGNPVAHSLSPCMHNPAFTARGIDAVYLPLRLNGLSELESLLEPLRIDGVSVTIPFKEDAFRFADEPDGRSRSSGAANTLLIRRERVSRRQVFAYNTDFDGVLGPLRRRGVETRGLSAAIIGAGGAARAAVRALVDAGATVTIHARSIERGQAAADALGVEIRPLGDLAAGRHGLIVNATPLGLKAGDPSPVPPDVFDARTIAFEMVYDPPETAFVESARARGAAVILGREMLVSQGVEQFRLFTGRAAPYEELEAGFLAGVRARRG